ncbi:hypothetical protein Q1695_012837 [Nippostrongylus brasiliensis]|nr:hypothetical protein Q1695_012837 [Nippostrongylus brasiliensis]
MDKHDSFNSGAFMIAGDVNYGPRLWCFAPGQQHPTTAEQRQADASESTLASSTTGESTTEFDETTTDSLTSGEKSTTEQIDATSTEGEKSKEEHKSKETNVASSGLSTPREIRMLEPLREQLKFVRDLARLTSQSRIRLIRVLVDAHNTLENIEDMMNETNDEILDSLAVVEERVMQEQKDIADHRTRVEKTLSPVKRRFKALQKLHQRITPLAKKVAENDTTTNLLRTNTILAKRSIAQMDDMDTLRRPPSKATLMEMNGVVVQVMSAMSTLRGALLLVDKYLSRSSTWRDMRPTMELLSHGIENSFLNEFPGTSLKEYLECCSPTSSNAENSLTAVENASPKAAVEPAKVIKLEPWLSASLMSLIRTSYVSSSELLSAKMGFKTAVKKGHELTPESGDSNETGDGCFREDVVMDTTHGSHANTNGTLSSCSSFEDAELLSPIDALIQKVSHELLESVFESGAVSNAVGGKLLKAALSSKRMRSAVDSAETSVELEPLKDVLSAERLKTAVGMEFLQTALTSERVREAIRTELLKLVQNSDLLKSIVDPEFLRSALHSALLKAKEQQQKNGASIPGQSSDGANSGTANSELQTSSAFALKLLQTAICSELQNTTTYAEVADTALESIRTALNSEHVRTAIDSELLKGFLALQTVKTATPSTDALRTATGQQSAWQHSVHSGTPYNSMSTSHDGKTTLIEATPTPHDENAISNECMSRCDDTQVPSEVA